MPSTGQWVDASPTPGTIPPLSDIDNGFEMGAALRLPAGDGNSDSRIFEMGANGFTAYFDEATSAWSRGLDLPPGSNNLPLHAADAPAAELPNGKLLLALSTGLNNVGVQLYEFDPNNSTTPYVWLNDPANTQFPSALRAALASVPTYRTRMLVVPNGHVLFSITNSNQIWDYAPDGAPAEASVPHVTGYDYNSATGVYTLHGTGLTGVSAGAAYGDDAEMDTNFPIVKIVSRTDSNVWYAKSTNWTPGVAEGASTVQFTLPPNLPADVYLLQVSASGISSDPGDAVTLNYDGPMYVDTHWSGMSNGDPITDADPVTPDSQPGTFGVNCFASVSAAMTAAVAARASTGQVVDVVVNGSNGDNGSGVFHEIVGSNNQVPLYLQQGPVAFDELSDTTGAESVVVSGVTLTVGGDGGDAEYDGVIAGTGALNKTGGGTWTLAGNDYAAGGAAVNGGILYVSGSINGPGGVTVGGSGTLKLGAATALSGSTVIVNVTNGLDLNGFNATLGGLAGSADLNFGSLSLTVGTNNADTTYPGRLLSTPFGSLTKIGGGTLSLANTANEIGAMSVNAGTLFVTGALAAGNGVTVNNVASSVRLGSEDALAASTLIFNISFGLDTNNLTAATLGGLSGVGDISIGQTNLSVGADNANTVFDRVLFSVVGAGGSFAKVGTGTLTLSNSNGYAGATSVNAGTLQLGTSGALPAGTAVTLANVSGAALDLNGHSQTVASLSGGGSAGGNVLLGSGALTVGDATSSTYAGVISGSGTLVKTGSGTLILTGANTYGGGTTVSAGSTLQIGSGDGTGSISGNVADSGGLIFKRSDSITFPGAISGGGTVIQAGSGTLTLAGANIYTGGTTVSAGTLQIGSGGTSGSITGSLTDNAALAFNRSDTVTFPGVISGSGSLAQTGSGRLILTGSDAYTGATTVSAGTLEVDGSLGTQAALAGTVTAASGATLQGTGTINAPAVVAGTLEAGTATTPGVLTINDSSAAQALTLTGALDVRIDGANPGGANGYDEVKVTGNVTLGNPNSVGPTLNVTVGYTRAEGAQFDIIDIGSAYSRVGTFGTAVVNFTINYTGGTSNKDIVLTWIYFGGGGD